GPRRSRARQRAASTASAVESGPPDTARTTAVQILRSANRVAASVSVMGRTRAMVVMRGLDPRIHRIHRLIPIELMDCRVEPRGDHGNDVHGRIRAGIPPQQPTRFCSRSTPCLTPAEARGYLRPISTKVAHAASFSLSAASDCPSRSRASGALPDFSYLVETV